MPGGTWGQKAAAGGTGSAGFGGGSLGPSPVYDPASVYSRGGGSSSYFGPGDNATQKRQFAQVGKNNINLLNPNEADYVPVDDAPEGPLGGIGQYYSPSTPGGLFAGLLGAAGEIVTTPFGEDVQRGASQVGQVIGKTLEAPLSIVGGIGLDAIPFVAPIIDQANSAIEENSPYILKDTLRIPHNIGGAFESILGVFSAAGRAVERTYAGLGTGEGGFLNRGGIENFDPALVARVADEAAAKGENLTPDQMRDRILDEAVLSSQGFTNDVFQNMLLSILTDPVNWATLGVGAVAGAAKGTMSVARVFSQAALREGSAAFRLAAGSDEIMAIARAGGALEDVNISRSALSSMRRALNEDMATRFAAGEISEDHLKFRLIERMGMSALGPVRDTATENLVFRAANGIVRATDPINWFSGSKAGKRSMEQIHMASATGVMASLKPGVVSSLTKLADELAPGGGDRIMEAIGSWGANASQEVVGGLMAKEATRVGAVPISGSFNVTEDIQQVMKGGGYDTNLGKMVEAHVERTKDIRVASLPQQARNAETAKKLASLLDVSAEEAAARLGTVSVDTAMAVHGLYYYRKGTQLHANVLNALRTSKAKMPKGVVIKPDQTLMITPRTLTNKRVTALDAALKARDIGKVRAIAEGFDDFNWLSETTVPNEDLLELVGDWLDVNRGFLPEEIVLIDPKTGKLIPGLPPELEAWAKDMEGGFGYGLANGLPTDAPLEAKWRITRNKNGVIKNAQPWLNFWAEGVPAAQKLSRWQEFTMAYTRGIRGERIWWNQRRRFITDMASGEAGNLAVPPALADRLFRALMSEAQRGNLLPRGMSPDEMMEAAGRVLKDNRNHSSGFNNVAGKLTERQLVNSFLRAMEGDVRLVGATQKVTGRIKSAAPGSSQNYWGQLSERLYPLMRFTLNPVFQTMELFEPYILDYMRGIPLPLRRSSEKYQQGLATHNAVRQLIHSSTDPDGLLAENMEMNALRINQAVEARTRFGSRTFWGKVRGLRGAKPAVQERKAAAVGLQARKVIGDNLYRAFREMKTTADGDASEFNRFWGGLEYEYGTVDVAEVSERWIAQNLGLMDADGRMVSLVADLQNPVNLGRRLRLTTDGSRPGDYTYGDVEKMLDNVREYKGETKRTGRLRPDGTEYEPGEALLEDLKTMSADDWKAEVERVGGTPRVGRISADQSQDIWRLANGPEVEPFWKGYRDTYLRGLRGATGTATRKLRDETMDNTRALVKVWAELKHMSEEEFIKLHFDDIPTWATDAGVLPPSALTDIRADFGYRIIRQTGAAETAEWAGVVRDYERRGMLDDPGIAPMVQRMREGADTREFAYIPVTSWTMDRLRASWAQGYPTTFASRYDKVGTDPVRALTRYSTQGQHLIRFKLSDVGASREFPTTSLKRVKSHDMLLDDDLEMVGHYEVLTPGGWKKWDQFATPQGVPTPTGLGGVVPGPERAHYLNRLLTDVFGEGGETYPWGIDFRAMLTPEEKLATDKYTGVTYQPINAYWRGTELPDGAYPLSDDRIVELSAQLDAAIKRGVLRERTQVYRGVALDDPYGYHLSGPTSDITDVYDKQVGEIISDKGYVSTSTDIDTASEFANSSGGSAHITYDLPPGFNINLIEGGEAELLMGRDIDFEVVRRSETTNRNGGRELRLTLRPVGEAAHAGVQRDMLGSPPLPRRNEEILRQLAASDPAGLRELAARTADPEVAALAEEAIVNAGRSMPSQTVTVGNRRFGQLTPEQTLEDITGWVDENDLPAYRTAWADVRGRIEAWLETSGDPDTGGAIWDPAEIQNSHDTRVLAALGAAMAEDGGREAVQKLLSVMERLWQGGVSASVGMDQTALAMAQDILRGLKHPMTTPRMAPRVDDSIDVLLANTTRRATGRSDMLQPIVANEAAYEGAGFLTEKTLAELGMEPPAIAGMPTVPAEPAVLTGDMDRIKGLGGSTGAELVSDYDTGRLFVEKKGNSSAHIIEESIADDVYTALGVPVPKQTLIDAPRVFKRANYIEEGTPLDEFVRSAPAAEVRAIEDQLAEGFALDSLLANWDAIGLVGDNVVIKNGVAYRVDNGGSLRFRAQGAPKGGMFGETVGELQTLRNPDMNEWGARVYRHLSDGDIRRQIETLDAQRDTILAALPEELRGTVSARLDDMLEQTKDVVPTEPRTGGQAADAITDDTHAYLVHHYNEVARIANETGLGGHKQWTAADMALLAGRAREEMGRPATTSLGEGLDAATRTIPAEVYFPPGSSYEWMNPLLDLMNRPENRAARHEFMRGVGVNLMQSIRDEFGILVDGLNDRGIGMWDGANPQPLVPVTIMSTDSRGDDLADILSYVMEQAEVWHYRPALPDELAGNWGAYEPRINLTYGGTNARRDAEEVAELLSVKLPWAKGATAVETPDGMWQLSIIDREGNIPRLPSGEVDGEAVETMLRDTVEGIGEEGLPVDLTLDYGKTYVAGPDKLPNGSYDWKGHLNATKARLTSRGSTSDIDRLDGVRTTHQRNVEYGLEEAAPNNLARARRREPITETLEDRRGGQTFGTTTPTGARASLIRGFGAADPLTGIHELVHVFSRSGMDSSLRDVVSKSWEEYSTHVENAAALLEQRAAATTNKSVATRFRNQANALRSGLQNPAPGEWGKAQEEHFVRMVFDWMNRGVPSNPELANVFEHFRNSVQAELKAMQQPGMPPVEVSPAMQKQLDRMFSRPGVETVPYSIEQETMRQAAMQAIRSGWDEAHATQYYKKDRSMIERSINHPYIGLYPASYMWGKVLPEMVRFLALRPWGQETPFLMWNVAREVSDSIRAQSENDPSFKQFLADNEDAFMLISMLFPGLPQDVPANVSLPVRRIAEQGLERQKLYAAGGTPEKGIDVTRGATEAIQYAVGPLGTVRTVSDIGGMASEFLGGIFGGGAEDQPREVLPLR